MNGWLIFYMVTLWIANIIFCAWLADMKERNPLSWAALGAIFPGLAIVAIAGASDTTIRRSEKVYSPVKDVPPDYKPEKKIIKCGVCKQEFTTLDALVNHLKESHPGNKQED